MSEEEAPKPAPEPAAAPPQADPPEPPETPEGEPAPAPAEPEQEAAAAPEAEQAEAPTVDKLTAWSQKLSRKKGRLDAREGRLADRERAIQERESRIQKDIELLDADPMSFLDKLAERHGTTRAKVYEQWMQTELRAGTPDEKIARIEAKLERDAEERRKQAEGEQQKAKEQVVQQYARDVHAYIGHTLEKSGYDYLKPYGAQQVADRCLYLIMAEYNRTGREVPVDEALSYMNNATKAEYEKLRQREAATQVPNSEQNGAVQSAQPASRKRAVTNAHAAAQASPADEDDDISDVALKRKAAEALRRSNTGWR